MASDRCIQIGQRHCEMNGVAVRECPRGYGYLAVNGIMQCEQEERRGRGAADI